jgi:hypothetical protein
MGISKEEVFIKFKELKLLASSEIWSECIYQEYWKIQHQESEQRRREDIDSMFDECVALFRGGKITWQEGI